MAKSLIRVPAGTTVFRADTFTETVTTALIEVRATVRFKTKELWFEWVGVMCSVAIQDVEILHDSEVCPACGEVESRPMQVGGIRQCVACNAVFGECMYRDSLQFVLNWWCDGQTHVAPDDQRYYDFRGLDEYGQPYRRHGWYDIRTRRITQTG
jgi:uncharacterized paraquat-inducible protein A